jgi:outer membrane protein OmpA-like peptidoglycan-associated protein
MAENWLEDVRKYAADADEAVVTAIVKYCGIALQSRDGQLVAMSDKKERETVRENYLKKKLGLTQSDAELDEGVLAVGEIMKADRTKNRVTVYYLLAERFGQLGLFGGVAGAAVAGIAGAAAGLGAMAANTADSTTAPLAAAAPVASAAPEPEPAAASEPVMAYSGHDEAASAGGGWGWLKWLLLALLALALIFFLLRSCSDQNATSVAGADADTTTSATADAADKTSDADATASTEPAAEDATATAAAAVPTGSGVVAGERNGKPMLTVYFDQAKTNIPADFDKVAATIKDYAAKNPGAKFAVSGFNSPTGSAAGNARLSKGRAENVGAALQKLGVAAGAITLVKPADATQGQGEDAQARRVEVTVQ